MSGRGFMPGAIPPTRGGCGSRSGWLYPELAAGTMKLNLGVVSI